jgi:microcompartment protein CcmK/EutM
MKIARVVGQVVATKKDPKLEASALLLVQPVDEKLQPQGKPLVASDTGQRHGNGEIVFFVTSGDATFTGLTDERLPVDAAIVGIANQVCL